jgi:hypothetical protein
MRLLLMLALVCGLMGWLGQPTRAAEGHDRPYGIARRVPWTTSRVVGSPEPPPPYRVTRAFSKLTVESPIAVAHEPGTRSLLLVHQLRPWVGAGRILRFTDVETSDRYEVLLDLNRTIYGLAFHPDYEKNGYLFVGSNGPVTEEDRDIPGQRFRPEAKKTTRISRYTVERKPPYRCDPKSEKVILDWPSNGHNGGDLAFGPDGLLYLTSGDGTSDSDTDVVGQDLSLMLAKVLRIDVEHPSKDRPYAIPRDNPFLDTKGARPETFAYGFRNPWRIHIDRPTGDIWVGNNGQDLWEQVYLVQPGANYGWSVYEGSHPFYPNRKLGPTPVSQPIVEHHHSEARSMTGGLVYHGTKLPALRGAYVYGDYSTGKIWGVRHNQGKVTWHQELADTTLEITGFGTDSKGELLIVDHGGGLYRLEPAPRDSNPAKFPTRLSETGLFLSTRAHQPHPALVPYSVNAPLWSDGAAKERFIALPGTSQIDFTTNRGWNFPEGAVLVKTFSLRMDTKDPASRRRIETRLLTRQEGEWAGYSYVWNEAQTDATLVDRKGLDRVFPITDPGGRQGKRRQTWHYPSRAECMVCHSRAANFVLGPSLLQMNKVHDYDGVKDNQLRTLEHLGIFRINTSEYSKNLEQRGAALRPLWAPVDRALDVLPGSKLLTRQLQDRITQVWRTLGKHPREASKLPRLPDEYPRLVDPADRSADLGKRARSYLHANCSQCHVTAGGGNAAIDLEFTTPLDKMGLVEVPPRHQDFALPRPRLLAPGAPERSVLYHRLARRGQGQMPPLATSLVDEQAVAMLRAWIKKMKR